MKLAIAVTYIVNEPHARLLDLQLARIARHTSVPHTIFGSVNRLLPRFREVLGRQPRLRLFELPPTGLRGAEEHSYYLEQLIEHAIADGATHVATLHVDSFPVADGWAEALAARIDGGAAFATIQGINTACLFVPRQFLLRLQPRLLGPARRDTEPEWQAFLRETAAVDHSGTGYGFAAWSDGLPWHSMAPTATAGRVGGGVIYDRLVLHMGGALRHSEHAGRSNALLRRAGHRRVRAMAVVARRIADMVRAVTPLPLRRPLGPVVAGVDALELRARRLQADGNAAEIDLLMADPDGYLAAMRSLP